MKKIKLPVPSDHLNLDYTFLSGQIFHWIRDGEGGWQGTIGSIPVTLVRINAVELEAGIPDDSCTEETVTLILRFLRMDTSLSEVQESLTQKDSRLAPVFRAYPGLRLLKQDPFPCLVGFICSVVTNIPRIRLSITELCRRFGRVDGPHCIFPALHQLAEASPADLRVGAIEFRARTLSLVCRELVQRGGEAYLESLRDMTMEDARKNLESLPGIGPKIADCVLLFALGFDEAFPLDTHTWRVAEQWFDIGEGRGHRDYRRVSALLRGHFGRFAGWAQQYLYFAELHKSRRNPLKNLEELTNS